MFREIMRKKQQLTQQECIEILRREPRGVLSVQGDDGYPYGLPINQYYDDETGHLFFHCGPVGHKLDAIARCDKVSFCCYDQGYRREGEWALNIKSVIVFGRIRRLEAGERALELCRLLSRKFTDDEEYIEREVRRSGPGVVVLELVPEHMSGKLVNES